MPKWYFCHPMIRQLSIRNYVLIEQLDLTFEPGLTIITGETGAGKSILLGALGLVLGDRAESGVHARPDTKVVIEAVFDIREYNLNALFAEQEWDWQPELILRREINAQGRSRAFVNDTPASLQSVRELGRRLIDIHQQFDQLDVLEEQFQLSMLDALAGQQALAARYREDYRAWRVAVETLAARRHNAANASRELDFLKFQLAELQSARLDAGELDKLETDAARLRHAEDIQVSMHHAATQLADSEYAALDQLREVSRLLQPLAELDEAINELAIRLVSAIIELEDWTKEARKVAERIESDPQKLDTLEQRLDLLNKLLQKHRVTDTDELIQLRDDLATRVAEIDHSDEALAGMEAEVQAAEAALHIQADTLSKNREKVAAAFVRDVEAGIAGLGMGRIRLTMELTPAGELLPTGADKLFFGMAQQEGGKFTSVRQAASGGELSRLTLVIKSLVAAAIPLPTLVFDEIDAGVSGAVSMKVGDILTRMAGKHQLLVITHSPQIAARANTHLYVSKDLHGGEVRTHVNKLSGDDRIYALATMLSTDPPGQAALANARELIVAGENG